MAKKKCPKCGGNNILPILYGEPTVDAVEKSGISYVLGGCCVGPETSYCKDCEHSFGKRNSPKKIKS